mmetsp:Transcript_721/g.2068  ORF Transcript_721/g.2068 Transcript_721/m.2068 type:complete len:384 (+) Transcript_721:138-1289(+)
MSTSKGTQAASEAATSSPPNRLLLVLGMFCIQLTNVGYTVVVNLALGHKNKDGHMNVLVFSFLRDALAFPILLVMAWIAEGIKAPRRGDLPRFLLLGLTGMFGNQYLFILGMSMMGNGVTIPAVTTRFQPVFGSLIAMLIGLEQFRGLKLASVLLAVGGALMMSAADLQKGGAELSGVLVLLAGALSMSLFYILQKPVVKRYPPVSITAWSYFSGAALMGLATLQYAPWTPKWEAEHCKKGNCRAMWNLDSMTWIAVAFAVVLNSILKYILITVCNKHATVTEIMMWGTLVPILSAIADPIIDHVHLDPYWQYAGIVPIFAGLFLIRKCNMLYPTRTTPLLRWQKPLLRLLCGRTVLAEKIAEFGPSSADGPDDESRPLLGVQ